jgi:hypothetical protein
VEIPTALMERSPTPYATRRKIHKVEFSVGFEMDSDRILIVGHPGPFRESEFWDPPNLAEFNAVIWYPKSPSSEVHGGHTVAVVGRFAEFADWIKEGHALVVIGAPIKDFKITYVQNNRHNTLDPLTTEIFRGVSFRHTSGTLIEYCEPDFLSNSFSPFVGSLSYDAVLNGNELVSLFRVSKPIPGSDQLVGAYKKLGKGLVVFLPPLTSANPRGADFYIYHLTAASILDLLRTPPQEELPAWAAHFQTPLEQDASQKFSGARGRIREIEAEIEKLQHGVDSEQSTKLLFTATGDVLTTAVAAGLRELGLKVVEGPKQRADLIACDGKRLAAIEVKGLEGPAREKNIGQVKRWTSDLSVARSLNHDDVADDSELVSYRNKLVELGVPLEQSADETDYKGIAILGTYRKMPLDQRPESFPDPVERVIVRSSVCALTGLQLFVLLRESRATPSLREEIINKLFETNGVLEDGRSWQAYLQKLGSS